MVLEARRRSALPLPDGVEHLDTTTLDGTTRRRAAHAVRDRAQLGCDA
jgi:hypothetical protein